jgi:hypothetical protein
MSKSGALQKALEALHAAVLCYGAARRTNYATRAGRRHVEAARRRLTRAEDAYYTIAMSIREG